MTVAAGLLSIGSVLRTVESQEYAGHYRKVVSTVAPGERPADRGWYETLVHGTELAGFPAAHLVVVLLLLTVAFGMALQFLALHRLAAWPAGPEPRPSPDDSASSGRAAPLHRRASNTPIEPATSAGQRDRQSRPG